MSLEAGCRERLLQSEDGRRAVALLDAWERRLADHEAEIARLRDALEFETDCLAAARKSGKTLSEQRSELRASLAEAKGISREAAVLLEQREEAYKLLREEYEREKRTYAVYRETAEHFLRVMQLQRDQMQPLMKACLAVPERPRREAHKLSIPWLAQLLEAIAEWQKTYEV